VLKVHFGLKHSSVHRRKISTGLGCGKIRSWQHWDEMSKDIKKQLFGGSNSTNCASLVL